LSFLEEISFKLMTLVHSLSPRGVFTLFLRDKPETDMREIAVLRFLCIGCCERSEPMSVT